MFGKQENTHNAFLGMKISIQIGFIDVEERMVALMHRYMRMEDDQKIFVIMTMTGCLIV
jgi:hypothetical protein